MSLLRRIEKSLDGRLRSLFAGGGTEPGAREAVELYRDALEQIAGRSAPGKRGDRVLAHNLITVELRADEPDRKAVLETIFDPGQLLDDVHSTLKAEHITAADDLTVQVTFPAEAQEELRIVCEKTEKPAGRAGEVSKERWAAWLLTTSGTASMAEYRIDGPSVNLGRVEDVADASGRTVRRNELFFPEQAHEANTTVSRAHAHIRFDGTAGEWRIYDDGSSLGTTVFRAGRRIDVPAHSGRGIALRAGDEIYLGRVRMRFEPAAASR